MCIERHLDESQVHYVVISLLMSGICTLHNAGQGGWPKGPNAVYKWLRGSLEGLNLYTNDCFPISLLKFEYAIVCLKGCGQNNVENVMLNNNIIRSDATD